MSKPLIVLADRDEKYIATLEYKFLDALGDAVELEIITDEEYFQSYFQTSRTAEIVAVGESLYFGELQKHNISNLFLLSEEQENGNTEELTVTRIFKYSAIKEIYNELIYRSRDKIMVGNREQEDTKVIALYSAVGGTGKTSLSLGLADGLVKNHQRVFYMNTESMQSFAYYLRDMSGMPSQGYRCFRDDAAHIYHNMKEYIRKEGFSYLPPFDATLDALNCSYDIYKGMIQSIKESGEYDFVIVDIEAGYTKEKMELLQLADKVLMVVLQDALSAYKTEYLLQNIELRDREKYIFLCNRFDADKENAYANSQMLKKFAINEYIENIEEKIEKLEQLSGLNSIQKLAYMFI